MTEQQAQNIAENFAKNLADKLRQEQQAQKKWLEFLEQITEMLL
jgi:hypothetical protein